MRCVVLYIDKERERERERERWGGMMWKEEERERVKLGVGGGRGREGGGGFERGVRRRMLFVLLSSRIRFPGVAMGVGVTMVGGGDGKDGGLRAMAVPSPATTRVLYPGK
jgi:hypothetical protein